MNKWMKEWRNDKRKESMNGSIQEGGMKELRNDGRTSWRSEVAKERKIDEN